MWLMFIGCLGCLCEEKTQQQRGRDGTEETGLENKGNIQNWEGVIYLFLVEHKENFGEISTLL